MPLKELYSCEINGVVTRVTECTVSRRRKKIKDLLYNSKTPIRHDKRKKIAIEYCEQEGLKLAEKDGGLILCDFSHTSSNDSNVSIEISSEDHRPIGTSDECNDLYNSISLKEMDTAVEETPSIVEPEDRFGSLHR